MGPPFDGHPPLKSPFDHRQQNKKKKILFKEVINSNWIHDRLEVIEFPQLSREMISQLIKSALEKCENLTPQTPVKTPLQRLRRLHGFLPLCTVCCNSGSYLLLSF